MAFKLCCELIKRNGRKISIESLLKIAAIGTVADVAPLVGENRTIAWLGLQGLADPRNPGLRALMRRLGLLGRALRAVDIGFKIGPRINAAGRLSSAETAIDLFAAASEETAWELCAELDRMNSERQEIERAVREEAEEQVLSPESCALSAAAPQDSGLRTQDSIPRVIILAGEGWHKGVIGLTAGRVAQKYHRPTLVISIDGDHCAGSARSIPSINLHAQLETVADLFTHFGGHDYACGFSLETHNLPALRERLAAQFATLDAHLFSREAKVDAALPLAAIDAEFLAAHEMLQPFGAGNPQPLFLGRDALVLSARTFAPDCTELVIEDASGRATAVVWPSAQTLAAQLAPGARADVLFHVEPDAYAPAGARLEIVDARPRTRSTE